MHSRRDFLMTGMGAVAAGLGTGALSRVARAGLINPCDPGSLALPGTRPLASAPLTVDPVTIDGFKFAPWFTGDDFPDQNIPFHTDETPTLPKLRSHAVDRARVAVIGGGISGLSTAYMLRRFNPVVFELRDRFGGAAQGGAWEDSPYTLGSAYVITPDDGGFLDTFYRDLRLHEHVRVDENPITVELGGKILADYINGQGFTPDELPALAAYRALVDRMANETYPDVPFTAPWMLALDQLTFKQHIEQEVGLPIPPLLASGIQAYCYSSFGAGWEEISAASGWNFLAAEEFGRWVFPGGNAYMADRLWEELGALDANTPPGCRPNHLRAGCKVVDVRMDRSGDVRITYQDRDGRYRIMLAEYVVMACSKHIAKYMLPNLETLDEPKFNAMELEYRAYAMVNVLLNTEIPPDFYDVFLLRDGAFPANTGQAEQYFHATDVLDGSFTPSHLPPKPGTRNVLTFYWPLSYPQGRFDLVLDDPYARFASAIAAQLREVLPTLELDESSVEEVRLTRWGHALPLAEPGFIASGKPAELLRPFEGKVYFVNQDNWALPAVENCVFDAVNVSEEIASQL